MIEKEFHFMGQKICTITEENKLAVEVIINCIQACLNEDYGKKWNNIKAKK